MNSRMVWLLGGLVLAGIWPASAKPVVTVNTEHYEIQGKSASELMKQMRRHGPKGFWAYTTWSVQSARSRWDGSCIVSLEINYTYPRWTNYGSASASLRDRWDRMMTNLRLHEEGHGEIGMPGKDTLTGDIRHRRDPDTYHPAFA